MKGDVGSLLVEALSKIVFNEAYERIKNEKRIRAEDADKLQSLFGDRFTKALHAIDEGRVRKHVFSPSGRLVWTVVGEKGEYQILPLAPFCSCNDFYFRVLSHEAFLCYHLLAQRIAEALNKYVQLEGNNEDYATLLSVLRTPAVEKRKLLAEEVENVRKLVETLLRTEDDVSARQLLIKIQVFGFEVLTPRHLARQLLIKIQVFGFEVLTPRHLAAILVADKKKRFKCKKGLWTLQ
jgi:predicted nucleic acid-binding Zn finger protein